MLDAAEIVLKIMCMKYAASRAYARRGGNRTTYFKHDFVGNGLDVAKSQKYTKTFPPSRGTFFLHII
jgi:hypothetical protein